MCNRGRSHARALSAAAGAGRRRGVEAVGTTTCVVKTEAALASEISLLAAALQAAPPAAIMLEVREE